jgi:uncharacterized membrane protein YoaT (DUF817 family)
MSTNCEAPPFAASSIVPLLIFVYMPPIISKSVEASKYQKQVEMWDIGALKTEGVRSYRLLVVTCILDCGIIKIKQSVLTKTSVSNMIPHEKNFNSFT